MLPSQFRRRSLANEIHTNDPLPKPTLDVYAAEVYTQEWQHESGRPIVGFMVLALDVFDADVHGGIRLASKGDDASGWRRVKSHPLIGCSVDLVLAVLAAESDEERAYREQQFLKRDAPRAEQ